MISKKLKLAMGLVAGLVIPVLNVPSALANGWEFSVTNSGSSVISRIEAAEKGSKRWLPFTESDIRPGETITLEWDSSTNDSDCVWKLRAVYADGSVSKSAAFDFCKETNLEFDN
jgi:hypothetical protein